MTPGAHAVECPETVGEAKNAEGISFDVLFCYVM